MRSSTLWQKTLFNVTVARTAVLTLVYALAFNPSPAVPSDDSAPAPAPRTTLSEWASGLPVTMKILGPESFKGSVARRLKEEPLFLPNYRFFDDHNISVSPYGLDEKLNKDAETAVGYVLPAPKDPESIFVPLDSPNATQIWHAYGYGGIGMNENLGAGRDAGRGNTSVKGIGPTAMIGPNADWLHRNGGLTQVAAVFETVWGDVLNRSLPYGANRAAGISFYGKTLERTKFVPEPAVGISREASIRPANFMRNDSVTGEAKEWDLQRVLTALKSIEKVLPQPEGVTPPTERPELIRSGILEFVRRVAAQNAAAYSRRLYHGATSPSNIEMSGRFIDYGTETSLPGYIQFKTLDDDAPFGDTSIFERDLIHPFVAELRALLPQKDAALLPTDVELSKLLNDSYRTDVHREMLRLTGVPDDFLTDLARSPSGSSLGEMLFKLSKVGNEKVIPNKIGVPFRNSGKYDLAKLLAALSKGDSALALKALAGDKALAQEVGKTYSDFRAATQHLADAQSISKEHLDAYFKQATVLRNRTLSDLYLNLPMRLKSTTIDQLRFLVDKNINPTADLIEDLLNKNMLDFDPAGKFQLVVSEHHVSREGRQTSVIYDMKTGKYHTRVKIARRSSDFAVIDGKEVAWSDLRNARLNGGTPAVENSEFYEINSAETAVPPSAKQMELVLDNNLRLNVLSNGKRGFFDRLSAVYSCLGNRLKAIAR